MNPYVPKLIDLAILAILLCECTYGYVCIDRDCDNLPYFSDGPNRHNLVAYPQLDREEVIYDGAVTSPYDGVRITTDLSEQAESCYLPDLTVCEWYSDGGFTEKIDGPREGTTYFIMHLFFERDGFRENIGGIRISLVPV